MRLQQVGYRALLFAAFTVACAVAPELYAQGTVAAETSTSKDAKLMEVLARPVTVELNKMSVRDALHAVALRADVSIQYHARVVNTATTSVTLHAIQMPLGKVFERVLAGTRLQAVPYASNGVTIVSMDEDRAIGYGTVVGTVIDATTKRPIARVSVVVERTQLTALTDEKGEFRIAGVPSGSHKLIARRLSYSLTRLPVEMKEDATLTVEFVMTPSVTPLNEVVTTVTGPQRRMELGNAIGRISNVDSIVKESPVTTLSQLLTGRVPGMVVTQSQGTVGGNVRLQIRGMTSLLQGGSSEPIVVVDGVRYQNNIPVNDGYYSMGETRSPLNDLNPNDIETVEVVKGPSAATLYGPDASNGVIVITTKKGKAGPPRWNAFGKRMFESIPTARIADSYIGWGHNSGGFKFKCDLLAVGRGECVQDSVVRVSAPSTGAFSVLQPAKSWSSGASVSGGQQMFRYFFAANADQQLGAIGFPDTLIALLRNFDKSAKLPDELRRPNAQTMFDLRSNIATGIGSKIDLTVNASYTHSNTRNIELTYGPFSAAMTTNSPEFLWFDLLRSSGAQINEVSNRFTTSVNAGARVASWVTARGNVGVDALLPVRTAVWDRPYNWLVSAGGNASDVRGQQTTVTADLGATATATHDAIRFRTSVGGQFVRSLLDMVNIQGIGLPLLATSVHRTAQKFVGNQYEEKVTLGGYVEQMVSLFDRVFLTGALRSDGASTFGEGFNAAVYPKVSASWVLSQEPWMAGVPGIDELRLRSAYGLAGRQPPSREAKPRFDLLYDQIPNIGPGRVVYQTSLGNPELRPERGQEFEVGVDAGFINRRLQLEATAYRRRTSDQIVSVNLPVGLGGRLQNLGLTTERGTELQVTATVIDVRPLSWTVTLQRATRATKLVELGTVNPLVYEEGGYVEGYPLGARFIWPIKSFSDANSDGVISGNEVVLADSAVYAGENSTPRTTTVTTNIGLLNNRVRLSALLDRQSGVTQIDGFFGCYGCRERNDPTTPLAVQAAVVARETFFPGKRFAYIEQGGFTRLREVSAAVTLPDLLVHRMGASTGSVSLSARNLGLWSHFSGADPESGALPGRVLRSKSSALPQNRTFVLRCDLSL